MSGIEGEWRQVAVFLKREYFLSFQVVTISLHRKSENLPRESRTYLERA